MTLATIFGSVLGPSAGPRAHGFSVQRSGGGGGGGAADFYHHGSYKKHKGKAKSEKKHAILSALTLLAFLFFLSILQGCIREQYSSRAPPVMFAPTGPTAPTGHQSKDQAAGPAEARNGTETGRGRPSRTLLGFEEKAGDRRTKFIRNYDAVNNWTRELSQVSEKDLEDQKLKTSNFPLNWKNNRQFAPASLTRAAQARPERNDSVPLALRRFKKRERTSAAATEAVLAVSNAPPRGPEAQAPAWSPRIPSADALRPPGSPAERRKAADGLPGTRNSVPGAWHARREATPAVTPHPTATAPTVAVGTASLRDRATTPRSRRSDYGSSARPVDYDDYEPYGDRPRDEGAPAPPAPAVGLDLNTFQTFPVYGYHNHRRNDPYGEDQTTEAPAAEPPADDVDRMHGEVRVTTQQPLFLPTRTSAPYSRPPPPPLPPPQERFQHRHRHPVHAHHHRYRHPLESRYRYSPYRKTGAHEPPHFHEDYVVVAKYPQDEEPGFDLVRFLWSVVSSFARPLARLVPGLAKDAGDEPQCYDLLVCEAQRASAFMGPTAEALATTVGTLLTWAAAEDSRQVILDAINSGRENTCQQQIRDCEGRSGGKSAMTVIAQVMEMKLR